LLQTIVAITLLKIRVSFLSVFLADMAHQGQRLMHNCRPGARDGSCDQVASDQVASASRSSQTGQAAVDFCYLVKRRGETLASNYRQSNANDGRVIHARPAQHAGR
jgi:hypothetical protein